MIACLTLLIVMFSNGAHTESQTSQSSSAALNWATNSLASSSLQPSSLPGSMPNSPAPTQPSIMVVGDSISAAYGIASEDSWVTLLQQHLNQSDHNNYRVINASISGETTGGALSRLPDLLAEYQPNIVIIELGGNDGLRGFPIAQFRQNLEQLVTLSQAANAKVVLAGMMIPPNYGPRYTQMFYGSYELVAEKFSLPLIPFLLKGIATDAELMQRDGIHPVTKAQPLILRNVLPQLEPLL